MTQSKRSREGVVLIDHRNSPGVSNEFIRDNKLDAPAVGSGKVYESAFVVCHCCGGNVFLNPDRSRERGYCRKHDGYTCDSCALRQKLGAECVTIHEIMEKAFEQTMKGLTPTIV